MELIRKIWSQQSSDRPLLLLATLLLITIKLGLKIMQFQTLQKLLEKISQPQKTRKYTLYKIIWAITMVSPDIPGVVCLQRAMAAQVLLRRQGYPTELRLGVGKDNSGEMVFHAWVESKGKVVIGGLGNMQNKGFKPLV
ncbi:MAG: lasso peptide biosynthesis B2 protein [Gomphosphaeria aponina SAG 52.96 = DSM 107014]|uniref:Lasso peptide biosynthesis B2 protein n=1 Tax=Gomphosphaeria aponina SAG 52.96 = DSM 107014 TaxID=1521640 RepID=A0A941GT69_9CHRO|nr:lasso peptide biosynthesis B2 protein [Gomphosphaeria aponina SAG 52.96 = DSM 107014]